MARVDFLNVKSGDCSIIESNSGHVTVIDVSCGNYSPGLQQIREMVFAAERPGGNYGMCDKPTNPVDWLKQKGISNIFRFILTHPDMDHLDGLKNLFESLKVTNFWDSGVRRDKPEFDSSRRFKEEDWDYYQEIIDGKISGLKIVEPKAGEQGKFWNSDDNGGGGDYFSVAAPDSKLVADANSSGNSNDGSYVIVYRSSGGKFVFSGDAHDDTWEYILKNHENMVKDAAVLIAPHHGRKSGRSYDFLDTVNPKFSLFGCAPSEHLAYSAWTNRNLDYRTNNQCGNVSFFPGKDFIDVYIECESYAKNCNSSTTQNNEGMWYLGRIQ